MQNELRNGVDLQKSTFHNAYLISAYCIGACAVDLRLIVHLFRTRRIRGTGQVHELFYLPEMSCVASIRDGGFTNFK